MVEACAARGMRVVAADIEEAALEEAVHQLSTGDRSVLAVPTDVRDSRAVEELARRAEDAYGPVDLLVNNAGVGGPLEFSWELSLDAWRWVLETNLWGVIHGIHAFLPAMVERDRGTVVNMSSVGGLLALEGSAAYSASKFGIIAVSEALRGELGMRGSKVGVSVVCPGEVATRILEDRRNWPADLGPPPEDSEHEALREIGSEVAEAIPAGVDPGALAEQVIDAVDRGEFWITTDLEAHRTAILDRAHSVTGTEGESA